MVKIVSDWEEKYYSDNKPATDINPVQILTEQLTHLSRAYSIDTTKETPFSLSAKENDIIWTNGGKPDDTVVIVARIGKNNVL